MKRLVALAAVGFGVALGLIVGLRLEQAGLAVLVGVASGIVAALPGTLLVLYLWWKERTQRLREAQRPAWESRYPAYPPVVILQAGREIEPLLSRLPQGNSAPREFVIVGEEELSGDGNR
ncbi:MAG: hypothetical protein ACP5SI_03270 [Chloroflexia bacterium]